MRTSYQNSLRSGKQEGVVATPLKTTSAFTKLKPFIQHQNIIMDSSHSSLFEGSQALVMPHGQLYSPSNSTAAVDDDHSLKMRHKEDCTSGAQDQEKGKYMFHSDSMLPDTQPGYAVRVQQSSELAGCNETADKNDMLSSDSHLPDTQCQDRVQDIQHTTLISQEDQNILKGGTNPGISDTRLFSTAHFIKAHFQASKSLTVNDKGHGDSLSYGFFPATRPSSDGQLPDIQVFSSTQPQGANHVPCKQSHSPSTPSIPHDQDLPSTQISTLVQVNTTELDDLPHSALSNTISSSVTTKDSEISQSASSPPEAPNIPNLPARQNSSSPQPSSSLDDLLPDTQLSTDQQPRLADNGASASLSASQVSPNALADGKIPLNKISCRERKRMIVSPNRPPNVTKATIEWVRKTNWLLDPFREDDDCWLHPSPPPALLSVSGIFRPVGKLQKHFSWKDKDGKHSIVLNYGIVVKLINYQMTKQQQDGFVNKQWHLSHLCGNWTCLNPAHTTVEPGHINISRNNCFSHRSGCLHTPKCLKDKKVALGADGKLVDHSELAARGSQAIDEWDNWSSPLLVDDNDSIIHDFDDSESVAPDDLDAAESTSALGGTNGGENMSEPHASQLEFTLPT
ncbi:hypothetical protein DL98DRAFT_520327 [Cadophora sp. DSE1049]|nr:hypothetical protein DL98DRAFT_520327 [Cadophora sp. DSE1049]